MPHDVVPSLAPATISRYRALLDDWPAFVDAVSRPLPVTVWANRLRVDADELSSLLADEGLTAERIGWRPDALRIHGACKPGLLWSFKAGLFQVQEEAAMLAVRLLGPQPGERVLDLCAAPGNKTAEIALRVGPRGSVVAVDRNRGRLSALVALTSRLGIINVTSLVHDGTQLPSAAGSFDRVLVDAPCSAEGNIRRDARKAERTRTSAGFRHYVAGRQAALLRRAVSLCRPGGTIVYSTCTFAPEENEAVVERVLAECAGMIEPVSAMVDGLDVSDAVDRWEGRAFPTGARLGLRLWPHRSGTGGFFAAVFRRLDGPARSGGCGPCQRGNMGVLDDVTAEVVPWLETYRDRFGLAEEAFADTRFFRQGRYVRVAACDPLLPTAVALHSTGIPFVRAGGRGPMMTTAAALAFARSATRNLVELEAPDADAYYRRLPVTPSPEALEACTGPGYVLLRHRGHLLGVGWLRVDAGSARVDSLFPKVWALPAGVSGA